MHRNEATFTTEFLGSFRENFARKIPDIGNILKPFDAFLIVNWITIAIEFKYERWPNWLDLLEPHQFAWLKKVFTSGWVSIVIHYYKWDIYFYQMQYDWIWEINFRETLRYRYEDRINGEQNRRDRIKKTCLGNEWG